MELLAPANLMRSAVTLAALWLSKLVRRFSWVTHKIINFSITKRAFQLFSLSFWINIPRVSVSFNNQQNYEIIPPLSQGTDSWGLEEDLIVSYNSSTTFLSVYQYWTKRVRHILRPILDRVIEHPMGYRFYLLIYLIPKLLCDGQCWGDPSSVLQLVW